jgi:hypothetical protein
MGQLQIVQLAATAHEGTTKKKNPTWRVTIANDFEGFERCEIRELGRERHRNSREGQLSTSRRAVISDGERRIKKGKRS